ncbi:hypothetical protein GCM10010388_12840 [Streptomyces mauvecolor]
MQTCNCEWSTAPDHSCVHVRLHGKMHVHAGCPGGYTYFRARALVRVRRGAAAVACLYAPQ